MADEERRYHRPDDTPSGLSIRNAADLVEVREEQKSMKELIIRIDERTRRMDKDIAELSRQVVTRPEFNVVRAIAFGLVGLAMTMLMAALMSGVLVK
jgi:hypothetical protein